MLRWNERYQQWTVEKERHGERLFRRLSRDIGREQEGEARTMAAAILGEFREAQEAGGPGYLYVASHPAFPGMLKIVRREWFRVDLIQARAAILLFLQTP
jgi:hypothetical protein